jgi:hypothetical protein
MEMTEFERKKAYNPNQNEGSTQKDNFALYRPGFPAGRALMSTADTQLKAP